MLPAKASLRLYGMKSLALALLLSLSLSFAEENDSVSQNPVTAIDSSIHVQDYVKLTEILLEAVKELREKNLALTKSNGKLEKQVSLLEMQIDGTTTRMDGLEEDWKLSKIAKSRQTKWNAGEP
jgi:hypothetical protein